MVQKLKINSDFILICKQIQDKNYNLENWCLNESCDQFQTNDFCGGFDATEEEFYFSYYDKDGNEYWFQFPLTIVDKIIRGQLKEIEIRMVK